MQQWLNEYKIKIEANQQPKVDPVATALEAVSGQLAQLQLQQESICEYLEKGVYTIEMFTKRNTSLTKEIQQLRSAEADLFRQQGDGDQKKQAADRIIPTTQHILESYPLLTPAEKNRLWKLVMKKATVYRSPEDNLTVNIYPNLPK
jgi:chromosome segregation ATPase